jgi:hypothetical protein
LGGFLYLPRQARPALPFCAVDDPIRWLNTHHFNTQRPVCGFVVVDGYHGRRGLPYEILYNAWL